MVEDQSHIAAQPIEVGPYLRQRCAWCGAILFDYDLRSLGFETRVPVEDRKPATWEPGAIIRQIGGFWTTVDHEDGDQLPSDNCATLDPEVTR